MDRTNLFQKLKGSKEQQKVFALLGGLLCCVIALTVVAKGVSSQEFSSEVSFLAHSYGRLFYSLQEKVDEIRRLDEENHKLKLENSHLRLVLESQRYEDYAEKAQKATQAYEWKLSKETGNRTGRTLASIAYKIPTNLIPSQLYSLGTSYFKSRDDEKAAVIFTFLTGLEDDATYKTAHNYLTTGIAWYRLDNFELADFYFNQALRSSKGKAQLLSQAKLWKGLLSERRGQHVLAQDWLRKVMDQNPHSAEARWINPGGVEREPAAQHEN